MLINMKIRSCFYVIFQSVFFIVVINIDGDAKLGFSFYRFIISRKYVYLVFRLPSHEPYTGKENTLAVPNTDELNT